VTQRKGEVTKRRIDRGFPHQVAILIPEGGLVALLMKDKNQLYALIILPKINRDCYDDNNKLEGRTDKCV
jgi:hypothetical protein